MTSTVQNANYKKPQKKPLKKNANLHSAFWISVPLSVHRSCFVAPGLGAWGKLFPGHHGLGPGHSKIWAFLMEDGNWSSPSAETQQRDLTWPICQASYKMYMMLMWLNADHLQVLLGQALEFLLQLLDSLGQIIIPLVQQLVLVQQGLTLLLCLSNSLQLVGRQGNKDMLKWGWHEGGEKQKKDQEKQCDVLNF